MGVNKNYLSTEMSGSILNISWCGCVWWLLVVSAKALVWSLVLCWG